MEPFSPERYRAQLEESRKRVEKALDFEEPDRVPVSINVQGPYYAWLFGVRARAIYLASGAFTIYSLAKLAGRSPGRLHENIRFILKVLARALCGGGGE